MSYNGIYVTPSLQLLFGFRLVSFVDFIAYLWHVPNLSHSFICNLCNFCLWPSEEKMLKKKCAVMFFNCVRSNAKISASVTDNEKHGHRHKITYLLQTH